MNRVKLWWTRRKIKYSELERLRGKNKNKQNSSNYKKKKEMNRVKKRKRKKVGATRFERKRKRWKSRKLTINEKGTRRERKIFLKHTWHRKNGPRIWGSRSGFS